MPTKPSDLASTFTGWNGLLVLSSGNAIIDRIEAKINSGSGGVGKTITNWLLEIVRDCFNAVVGFLAPGVAGAFAYLQSDPSWLETLTTNTANALWQHRAKIIWLRQSYIPEVHHTLNIDIINGDNAVLHWANVAINNVNNFVIEEAAVARRYTDLTHQVLGNDITNTANEILRYTSNEFNAITTYLQQYSAAVSAEFTRQGNIAHAYTDDQVSGVEHKLALGLAAAAAALAALSTFITAVYVPDAIAAAIAALNAEAAVAMDVEWEFVATTANKAIAELTLADLNPMWATNALSEIPATSLAAACLDITAALRFTMNFISGAGVPLYRNLRQFGEDTSNLDGVITTALLGAFATAAITDPVDTAAVVTEVLGGPLNDLLLEVADLFNL